MWRANRGGTRLKRNYQRSKINVLYLAFHSSFSDGENVVGGELWLSNIYKKIKRTRWVHHGLTSLCIPSNGRRQKTTYFPRLAPVACFRALGNSCMFSLAWHRLNVFPRLAPVACFPGIGSRVWKLGKSSGATFSKIQVDLIRCFAVKYRRIFLRVVLYFDEPCGLVKIQTTSKNIESILHGGAKIWILFSSGKSSEKIKFISLSHRVICFFHYIDKISFAQTTVWKWDMSSSISSLVRIWKIRHSSPGSGCSFVWTLRVVYFPLTLLSI